MSIWGRVPMFTMHRAPAKIDLAHCADPWSNVHCHRGDDRIRRQSLGVGLRQQVAAGRLGPRDVAAPISRIARGDITADEGDRLLKWREWQIARQIARDSCHLVPPLERKDESPAPYYGPYVRYPAGDYWSTPPWVYWGPTICTSGFGRHFGMRICF